MKAAYGIFTPDGEAIGGTLHDEYALRLAERLDESTASLYISTKNGVLLLGTAVNVQKPGRRPDTVIYLERTVLRGGPVPEVDRAFIHAMYGRVERRLSEMDYRLRDPAEDIGFHDEGGRGTVTGLRGAAAADYTVGRLLLGKPVVCIAGEPSRSLDFALAVTEMLHTSLFSGFTIVVARRTFPDADLLVTGRYAGTAQIDLATEEIADPEWEIMYRDIGRFARHPVIRQILATASSRRECEERLVSEYTHSKHVTGENLDRFNVFLAEEEVGIFPEAPKRRPVGFPEPDPPGEKTHPDEADYERHTVPDTGGEHLSQEYEAHMERKRKAKRRLLVVLAAALILLGAILVLFVLPPGFIPSIPNESVVPHTTPSATIIPDDRTALITRLNTTPGNIPEGLQGVDSAYDVTVSEEQYVTIGMETGIRPGQSYSLMRYNQSGAVWEPVGTGLVITNESVSAVLPGSGIYRLFTSPEQTERPEQTAPPV